MARRLHTQEYDFKTGTMRNNVVIAHVLEAASDRMRTVLRLCVPMILMACCVSGCAVGSLGAVQTAAATDKKAEIDAALASYSSQQKVLRLEAERLIEPLPMANDPDGQGMSFGKLFGILVDGAPSLGEESETPAPGTSAAREKARQYLAAVKENAGADSLTLALRSDLKDKKDGAARFAAAAGALFLWQVKERSALDKRLAAGDMARIDYDRALGRMEQDRQIIAKTRAALEDHRAVFSAAAVLITKDPALPSANLEDLAEDLAAFDQVIALIAALDSGIGVSQSMG